MTSRPQNSNKNKKNAIDTITDMGSSLLLEWVHKSDTGVPGHCEHRSIMRKFPPIYLSAGSYPVPG